MRLDGSCHCSSVRFTVASMTPVPFMRCYCSICRKTAGSGGYAINIGAATRSMKVKGRQHLGIYRARLPNKAGDGQKDGTHQSSARRYFCKRCGSALWLWDPTWPDLVHPHAGCIDTPLPVPPEHVHNLVGSKASWVEVEGNPGDPCFKQFADQSLAEWHEAKGLTAT